MDFANTLKAKWKVLRGKAKEQWGELTDDDLDRVDGQFEILVGMLQDKYYLSRAKAEAEINQFLADH